MGRGTAWKAHDVDVVRGWLAAGKTTTAMATLRSDWSKSSIKKLVARLKAAGDDVGAVYSRKRSFRAVSSDQVDELRAELPTLPRVSVAVVAKKLGTSSSTAWRVLHDRLKKKPYKPIKSAWPRAQRHAPTFQRTHPKVVNTSCAHRLSLAPRVDTHPTSMDHSCCLFVTPLLAK